MSLRIATLLSILTTFAGAQLPQRVLAGYWQNWSNLPLRQVSPLYNVVVLAFAIPRDGTEYDLKFDLPTGTTRTAFLSDIATLHTRGTKVILSVGGGTDPVSLASDAQRDRFVFTLDSILAAHQDAIDGIDLDFESTSMDFGNWTIANPAPGQTRIVEAVRSVMGAYRRRTGRKLLLTMAPELVYIQGALSRWQTDNLNGGAWIPVLEALRDSIDLLMPQFYNAGGASGGIYGLGGKIWYDTGDPDFVVAMTETVLEGFPLLDGRGTFGGWPEEKFAVGLPSNSCNAAGTGYVPPDELSLAMRYLRGEIDRPASFSYETLYIYPELRGLMTWSINLDSNSCDGAWTFASTASGMLGPVAIARRDRKASQASRVPVPDLLGRSDRSGMWAGFVGNLRSRKLEGSSGN
jgi:chitinase